MVKNRKQLILNALNLTMHLYVLFKRYLFPTQDRQDIRNIT